MFNIKQALLQCKTDEDAVRQTLSFIEKNEGNAYSRKNAKGHITGSAFVVDGSGNILLNHHKKANIWIQFGGHCDDESDVQEVALRETMEETGFAREDLIFLYPNVFDCGVYDIPEGRTKNEPAHKHYDVNFLIMTKNKNFVVSSESSELRWCTYDEALDLVNGDKVCTRMIKNSRQYFK